MKRSHTHTHKKITRKGHTHTHTRKSRTHAHTKTTSTHTHTHTRTKTTYSHTHKNYAHTHENYVRTHTRKRKRKQHTPFRKLNCFDGLSTPDFPPFLSKYLITIWSGWLVSWRLLSFDVRMESKNSDQYNTSFTYRLMYRTERNLEFLP